MIRGVLVPEIGQKLQVDGETRVIVCGVEDYPNLFLAQREADVGQEAPGMLVSRDMLDGKKI